MSRPGYWLAILALSSTAITRGAALSQDLHFKAPPGWVREHSAAAQRLSRGSSFEIEGWLKPKGLKEFGKPLSMIVISNVRPGWTFHDFVKRASRHMTNVHRSTITLCNNTRAGYLTGTRTIRDLLSDVEAVFVSSGHTSYLVEYSRPQSDPKDGAAEAAIRGLCPRKT